VEIRFDCERNVFIGCKMNTLGRCRLKSRIFNYLISRRYLAADSGSSSKPQISADVKKLLKERERTLEPRITKGEVWSKANLAPQHYDTSMDDNFQRTTVNPIEKDMRETKRNYIGAYSEMGFTLHDETMVLGPIAVFPKTVLSWRVITPDDVTPESMLLFTILEPKLDIVVVGVGDKKYIRPVKERISPLFRKHSILLEVLETPDACATFNFLNNEGRYVAGALFPANEVIPGRKENVHFSWKDWDKSRYGYFGFSDVQSKNPIDDVVKRMDRYMKEQREAGAILPGELDDEKKSKK